MKYLMLPAILMLMIVAALINGGSNYDTWSLQRAIVFAGLLVAFAIAAQPREEAP